MVCPKFVRVPNSCSLYSTLDFCHYIPFCPNIFTKWRQTNQLFVSKSKTRDHGPSKVDNRIPSVHANLGVRNKNTQWYTNISARKLLIFPTSLCYCATYMYNHYSYISWQNDLYVTESISLSFKMRITSKSIDGYDCVTRSPSNVPMLNGRHSNCHSNQLYTCINTHNTVRIFSDYVIGSLLGGFQIMKSYSVKSDIPDSFHHRTCISLNILTDREKKRM